MTRTVPAFGRVRNLHHSCDEHRASSSRWSALPSRSSCHAFMLRCRTACRCLRPRARPHGSRRMRHRRRRRMRQMDGPARGQVFRALRVRHALARAVGADVSPQMICATTCKSACGKFMRHDIVGWYSYPLIHGRDIARHPDSAATARSNRDPGFGRDRVCIRVARAARDRAVRRATLG